MFQNAAAAWDDNDPHGEFYKVLLFLLLWKMWHFAWNSSLKWTGKMKNKGYSIIAHIKPSKLRWYQILTHTIILVHLTPYRSYNRVLSELEAKVPTLHHVYSGKTQQRLCHLFDNKMTLRSKDSILLKCVRWRFLAFSHRPTEMRSSRWQ